MENKTLRVMVAHPGKQHSFRLASALKNACMLDSYCTTVYDKDKSFLMRFAKKIANKQNKKRAESRKCENLLDSEVFQFGELLGLITIIFSRIDKTTSRKYYFWMNGITSDYFGRRVAKMSIKRKVDAVVCYDTGARACFNLLKEKAPNILRIMDVSHAARPEERRLFQKETDETNCEALKNENLYLWNERNLNQLQSELELTDYFICPSTFVAKTIRNCGISPDKCYIVPYGANVHYDVVRENKTDRVVHFLYVGRVTYGKGVQYLLEYFNNIERANADLTIVGSYDTGGPIYKKYANSPNVNFVGWVLPSEVVEYYKKSDVFIILSPTEGLAQVGIEAMSCGLPIICADTTGVNDLVINNENGFVVKYRDAQETINAMRWFVDHPSEIRSMGNRSKTISQEYTWDNYENRINETFNNIKMKEKKI